RNTDVPRSILGGNGDIQAIERLSAARHIDTATHADDLAAFADDLNVVGAGADAVEHVEAVTAAIVGRFGIEDAAIFLIDELNGGIGAAGLSEAGPAVVVRVDEYGAGHTAAEEEYVILQVVDIRVAAHDVAERGILELLQREAGEYAF